MEKLISMRLFVEKKRCTTISATDISKVLTDIFKYEMFLRQPLTLGMFVALDKKGNVYVDYKTYQPKKGTICIPYEGLFEVSRKGKDVELLNEPQFWKDDQRFYNKRKYEEALKEYQEAKERVLFEGFSIVGEKHVGNKYNVFGIGFKNGHYKIVEDLINRMNSDQDILLTESAKKQIFGS